MVRRSLGWAAALALAAPALAAPPRVDKVECAWQRLSEARRVELLEGASPGQDGVGSQLLLQDAPRDQGSLESRLLKQTGVPWPDPDIDAAAAACGAEGRGFFLATAFLSRIREERARRWLTANRGLSEDRLEAAWRATDMSSLRRARRGKVLDWAPVVSAFQARLGLSADPDGLVASEIWLRMRWSRDQPDPRLP